MVLQFSGEQIVTKKQGSWQEWLKHGALSSNPSAAKKKSRAAPFYPLASGLAI
jgi:hypothetical protein